MYPFKDKYMNVHPLDPLPGIYVFYYIPDSNLVRLARVGKYNEIIECFNNCDYTKREIKDAINVCVEPIIVELLASYINKKIMKNIKRIQVQRLIWKCVLNWLTKPITRDGLLGIDIRLGLKLIGNLECAPLHPYEA